MSATGSPTTYAKRGARSRHVAVGRGPAKGVGLGAGNKSERLMDRMLLCTHCSVAPEMRAQGWYKVEAPSAEAPTNPRRKVDGMSNKSTQSGLASRGNVMHTRYLRTTP